MLSMTTYPKILTICPSLNRPEMLEEMIRSFDATIETNNRLVVVSDPIPTTQCFNNTFKKYPDYDFYHLTNDDVVYKTKGWDLMLANEGKISYGNDTIQGEELCTFPMIDGRLPRAVGWLQMPMLKKYCGDTIWMDIGGKMRLLKYVPEVVLEHRHFLNGKRDNYDTRFFETYHHDVEQAKEWREKNSFSDMKLIWEGLYGHQSHRIIGQTASMERVLRQPSEQQM